MKKAVLPFLIAVVFFTVYACDSAEKEPVQGDWIKGDSEAQIHTIESQFAGFGRAMAEVGYRYVELYWAGQDENWEYAEHQLEEIYETIELGLERRPKRAKSSKYFMEEVVPEMERIIESRDLEAFKEGFKVFTAGCNSCHAMEKMPFLQVVEPEHRLSPIGRLP